MHFVILFALYLVHGLLSERWCSMKGYSPWIHLLLCIVVGAISGIIGACIEGTNGQIAQYLFVIAVSLNYWLQVKYEQ